LYHKTGRYACLLHPLVQYFVAWTVLCRIISCSAAVPGRVIGPDNSVPADRVNASSCQYPLATDAIPAGADTKTPVRRTQSPPLRAPKVTSNPTPQCSAHGGRSSHPTRQYSTHCVRSSHRLSCVPVRHVFRACLCGTSSMRASTARLLCVPLRHVFCACLCGTSFVRASAARLLCVPSFLLKRHPWLKR
jgi:hypothetical protein